VPGIRRWQRAALPVISRQPTLATRRSAACKSCKAARTGSAAGAAAAGCSNSIDARTSARRIMPACLAGWQGAVQLALRTRRIRLRGPRQAANRKAMSDSRVLKLDGVHNFRDYGGYDAADGARVKSGLLWRSAQHGDASDTDLDTIHGLGITTVIDLRGPSERDAKPCRRHPGFAAEVGKPSAPP
jgi:hypothetical protein